MKFSKEYHVSDGNCNLASIQLQINQKGARITTRKKMSTDYKSALATAS